MGIHATLRFAGYCGAHNVTNTHHKRPLFLCSTKRSKGIGRFSRLGDDNDHVICTDNRVTVPELRSIINLNRDTGKLLNKIFSKQSGMPACSACTDYNALCLLQTIKMVGDPAKADTPFTKAHTPPHDIVHDLRLLKDLLEHEMFKPAFLYFLQ